MTYCTSLIFVEEREESFSSFMKLYNILVVTTAFCSGVFVDRFYFSDPPRTTLATTVTPQQEQKSPLPTESVASRRESSPCIVRDRLPERGTFASPSVSSKRLSRFQENYATVLRELGFSEQEVNENVANFYPPLPASANDEIEDDSPGSIFEPSPQQLRDEYEKVLLELELSPGDASQTAEAFLENVSSPDEMEQDQLYKADYEKVLHELSLPQEVSDEAR